MRLNDIKDNRRRAQIPRAHRPWHRLRRRQAGVAAAARARRRAAGVAIGGFEGGQMPLHRRLPKRGFDKWNRKD